MTDMEMREFAQRQVEWHKKFLAYDDHELEYIKEELKRLRKQDKELVEYIWAKGVVTKTDMEIFCIPNFVGAEIKKVLHRREQVYRSRKRNKAWIEYYEKEVVKYS